ncbi:hypothetical protein Tco_0105665 [Tanacetum coccineum]
MKNKRDGNVDGDGEGRVAIFSVDTSVAVRGFSIKYVQHKETLSGDLTKNRQAMRRLVPRSVVEGGLIIGINLELQQRGESCRLVRALSALISRPKASRKATRLNGMRT